MRIAGVLRIAGLRSSHALILNRRQHFSSRSFLHAHLRVRLQRMPARVRGPGPRQAESRMPEMPEQETGATALGVRCFGEEWRGFSTVFLGGAGAVVWVVRRSSRTGSLLAERPRLAF